MKEFFNKFLGFLNRIWMFLLGLEPSDSVKTFSPRERRVFFENLGYIPFFLFVPLWILGFFVNIFVGSEALGGLIVVSSVIFLAFWIPKFSWNVGPVKSKERDAEGCDFGKKEKDGAIHGFIRYNDHIYGVEYFDLDKNGELLSLSVRISEDEKSGQVVRVYYNENEKKFVERTEVKDEVYKSYEIVSWIFFASSLLAIFTLFIGALIIIL